MSGFVIICNLPLPEAIEACAERGGLIREEDQPSTQTELKSSCTNNLRAEVTAERGHLSRVRWLLSSLVAISIALRRERILSICSAIECVNFSPDSADLSNRINNKWKVFVR